MLQGGVLSADAADAFLHHPYAADALRLCRWHDLTKIAGHPTPDLSHCLALESHLSKAA
ncbi:hypothetical protein [Ralstonia solanacearum]|uniref:hypothetical protein n=1 Tax=Ralstonia solanacearum TaxID=305 RepID=UPI0018D52600|nr:hypothetical protein [Ralstonia solanacearum]